MTSRSDLSARLLDLANMLLESMLLPSRENGRLDLGDAAPRWAEYLSEAARELRVASESGPSEPFKVAERRPAAVRDVSGVQFRVTIGSQAECDEAADKVQAAIEGSEVKAHILGTTGEDVR